MSTRTLQDQINTLLSKSVILPKVSGVPSPDVETASIIESLALAMMLQPRAAYYAYYLAKNGLVAAINTEIAAIEALKLDIEDLGNVTYAIKDTSDLRRAQSAMLQLGTQNQMSSESGVFNRYSIAVDDFLNKQLAKNIKRPNATDMTRPGEEAGSSLPTDLTTLKGNHSDFLDRLYSAAVGISNFINTPFSSIVGTNAVYRSKADLDTLIKEIEADESGSQSRDAAIRLIAGRASLRTVGAPVTLQGQVVDTALHLPPDQLLSGESEPAAVNASTPSLPLGFVMAPGGSLSMTIDGQTITTTALNQAENYAAVLSAPGIVYPVDVPANYHLFLRLEAIDGLLWAPGAPGTSYQGTFGDTNPLGLGNYWSYEERTLTYFKTIKVTLNSGYAPTVPLEVPPGGPTPQPRTLADVRLAVFNALGPILTPVLAPDQPVRYGTAVEFVTAGSGRILIIANNPMIKRIEIVDTHFVMEPQSPTQAAGGVGATNYTGRHYTLSFHEELGFELGQRADTGITPASRIRDAIDIIFPSMVTTVLNTDGYITMTSLVTKPGVTMEFSGTWITSLGLVQPGGSSTYVAGSNLVMLQGTSGVVSPIGVVDIGDVLTSSTGSAVIAALHEDNIELETYVLTFIGNITVISGLYLVGEEINSQVQSFLVDWINGPFAVDLTSLDRVIAVLIGSPTSPRRSEAVALLDSLKTQLLALQASITTTSTVLAANGALKEKAVINNIVSIFTERGFDRALDLLLRCKLQELFELDWQTASYGGNLMKAAENIARADVSFPNTTKDEGFEIKGQRNRLP